jgi:hypothetical protein
MPKVFREPYAVLSSTPGSAKPIFRTVSKLIVLACFFEVLTCFDDLPAAFDPDFDVRAPGILPIRGPPASTSSHARSAADSKSGASTGKTCQPVTRLPNTLHGSHVRELTPQALVVFLVVASQNRIILVLSLTVEDVTYSAYQ